MNKVAILTICSMNYGNRLQNYALQESLKKNGYQVDTLLRAELPKFDIRRYAHYFLKNDKATRFYWFNRKISWSKAVVSQKFVTDDLEDQYNCFVIGSDQIWNPEYDFNSELDYLPMVPSDKKISYAASFGVSDIMPEKKGNIAKGLSEISSLSVREKRAVEMIDELTGQKAELVLDPTFLLDKAEWSGIEAKPRGFSNKKFIVCYFLGEDKSFMPEIKELSENKGLPIINIRKTRLAIGPCEFLYLIHHAELVCTDSFHACVFSSIFETSFISYSREGKGPMMMSRLDSLLGFLNLKSRKRKNVSMEDALHCDFSGVAEKIHDEQVKSKKWLLDALFKNTQEGKKYED